MIKNYKIVSSVILLSLALAGMTACGSKKAEEPVAAETETGEPAEEETAAEEPVEESVEESVEDEDLAEPVPMYAGSRVNVRSGASTDADVVTVLNRRQEVQKIGEEGEWTKILLDGETCYVASAYLQMK